MARLASAASQQAKACGHEEPVHTKMSYEVTREPEPARQNSVENHAGDVPRYSRTRGWRGWRGFLDGVDGWGPAMPWTALWAKDACDGPASALLRSVHLRCTSSSCVSSSDGLAPRAIVSLPVQRQVVGLTVLSSRFT